MNKYILNTSFLALSSGLLLSSCISENNKERSVQSVNTEIVADDENQLEEERIKKIFYTLPSPLEITKMFKKEGIEYNGEILHSTADRRKYSNKLSKSLNLGVYGADLSYSGLFAMYEPAIQYLAASQVLAEDLGIGTTFQSEFIVRLEQHAGNKDTLLKVVTDFFLKNDQDLRENNQQDISSYVLTGGWVEGMYLGTNILSERVQASGVRNIVVNQGEALHNIVVIFQNTNATETSDKILKMLGDLESIYNEVEGDMNQEQFSRIRTKIEETRSFIINL